MTLEEMQNRWRELDRRLDAATAPAIGDLRSARSVAMKQRWALGIDIAIHIVVAIAIGIFMVKQASEVPLLLSAASLHVFVVGLLISSVRQLVRMSRIDWAGAVTSAQEQVEGTRLLRIRTTKWALTLAPLLWVPLLAVTAKVLVDMNIYAALPSRWLIANFVFGVAFLGIVIFTSKHWGDRFSGRTWFDRLMDDVAGRSLARTSKFLRELASFRSDA
jgi:hypothetical protein